MKGKKALVRNLLVISKDRNLHRQLRACLIAMGLPSTALLIEKDSLACKTLLGKVRPHLIVLDDGIREGEGVPLLQDLHQLVPGVHIIYLTTHHTLELERTVRQLGVLYYTEKPPDPSLLGRLITSALSAFLTAEEPPISQACTLAPVK